MNLDTFFKNFELFADAPNAVAKMRELILHLAVRGKLVPQDPQDESSGELYQRIAAEKDRLVAAKAIKKEEPLDPIATEEYLFPIPDSWIWVRCGGICYPITSGTTPPQAMFHEIDGVPFLKVYNIRNQSIDFEYRRQFLDADYHKDKMKRSILRPGDVIMNIVGPPLGKVAIIPDSHEEWNCNQAIVFFRPIERNLADFIYLFIREGSFLANIQLIGSAGQDNISVTKSKNIPIALPPLAEQKRIVAKVDELMALCDRLEAQQQERETRHAALAHASLTRFADAPTPANLELLFHKAYSIEPAELRKSVLTLAVQGKLLSQDPNDEPADQMLKAISVAAGTVGADFSNAVPNPLGPVKDCEKPFELPSSWKWVRLGVIASIKHGFAFSSESFTSEMTSYVLTTPGNFYEKGGFRDRGSNTKYYLGTVDPGFVLKPRDLIIPMTEQAPGLLGSPAFIPYDGKTYLHNQRIGKLTFYSESIAPEFAFWFFNCSFFRNELAKTCTGMKVRHTSPGRILRVPFPVAPLAEQRRIVAKVEQLMALVDRLEAQLAESRRKAAALLEAVVAELSAAA